jgi:hypothetical protein
MSIDLAHCNLGYSRVSETRPENPPVKAILLLKDGKYFVYEPGIGVIASDENVEVAYARFNDARHEYVTQAEQAGLASGVSSGATSFTLQQSVWRELSLFVAKVCIVLAIVSIVTLPAIIMLGRSIDQAATNVAGALSGGGNLSLADVVRKAEDIARDARNLPEDRKVSLRQSIGAISREVAPFVDAWRNPPEGPANPPK